MIARNNNNGKVILIIRDDGSSNNGINVKIYLLQGKSVNDYYQ